MKKYLLSVILMIPLFGQVMLDETHLDNILPKGYEILESDVFCAPSETLKYDDGTLTNSVGLTGSGTPTQAQTHGFATYYRLSTFGITTPREVAGVMIYFGTINQPSYNFRLYIWNNVTQALLRPKSAGPHLYKDSTAVFPPAWTWGYFDLSSKHIVVPETVWVGICYNHLDTPADWYLGYDNSTPDQHTRGNLSGTASAWSTFTALGYPDYDRAYGVRLVVHPPPFANDVGLSSINIPLNVHPDTTFPPKVTVKNFGTNSNSFNVVCMINPGAYIDTEVVSNLPADDTLQVTFNSDFTFTSGSYYVTVYTLLGSDQDLTNDTLQGTINVVLNDVSPISIDIPSSVPEETILSPKATVKNLGTSTKTFPVTCKINPGAYTSVKTVSDLVAGDSFQVTFTPDFTFDSGSYTVKVYTNLSGDEHHENDTLVKVVDTYDPGITEDGYIPKTFVFMMPTIIKGRTTSIEFSLPVATKVDLLVYDAIGRLSRVLVSERFAVGTHRINADLDLATGVYFYRLITDSGQNIIKKFLVIE